MTEEYLLKRKRITKIKILLLTIVSIVIISLIILLHFNTLQTNNVVKALRYVVFYSMLAFVIIKMIVYIKMYINKDYLKQKEIERIDERNILIKLKSSSITLKTILFTMGCTTIITSFYSVEVFYTQLILFVLFLLVNIIVKFCYNKLS